MSVPLSALDETVLELEDGAPGAPTHLGAILVLDPLQDEPPARPDHHQRARARAAIQILGCTVREIHPLVPLAPEHAPGVAVISHADAMTFGVVTDFDAVPDDDEVISGVRDEHAELPRLAARRVAPGSGLGRQAAVGTSRTPRRQ